MIKKQLIILLSVFCFGIAHGQQDSLAVYALIKKSNEAGTQTTAIANAKAALEQSKKCGPNTQVSASRNLFQTQLKFNSNYEGLRTFFELNSRLERDERWRDVIVNYQLIAAYYESQSLYANAIQYYQKAAALAKSKNKKIDDWAYQTELGSLYSKIGNDSTALENFQNALNLIKESSVKADERRIISYRNIANTYYKLLDFEAAKEANLSALSIMKNYGEDERYVNQLNNVGYSYQKLGNSKEALNYFSQTLEGRQRLGYKDADHVPLLINIGIVQQNLHRPSESVRYLERAEAASKSMTERAQVNDLMAMAFLASDDIINAKNRNEKSLELAKKAKAKQIEAEAYLTASIIDEKALAYDDALANYKKHLSLKDSLEDAASNAQQQLLQAEYAIERTQGEIQGLIASNQIKDYQIEQLKLEAENNAKSTQIAQAAARAKLQALQLEQKSLEAKNKEREVAVLKAREENQRLKFEQQKLQEEKAVQDLAIAEEHNKVQQLELYKRRAANASLLAILALVFILACIMIYAFIATRKKNKLLAESREIIKQERDRSDDLLLNILPESTANELKKTGRAAPKKFESATVFFSDFKNFSALSKNYTPVELIAELEGFFGGFDKIIKKYHIEKIKTIGDAYMCASGIPIESNDHALRMVKAAMEMVEFTKTIHAEQIARGKEPWHMRVGINTGPVVAGVIGSNKFIYDVWGDSVNLAARLETAGEPDQINISQQTLDLVKHEIRTMYRGEIEVKNMGAVRMFFVVGYRKRIDQ